MKVDRILQSGVFVMLAAFIGVLYISLHDNVVKAGDTAPEFSIKAENGRTVTSRQFGGKLMLLNFWATWCPPCVQETPSLVALEKALGPKGLVIFGVSVDKDRKAYTDFIQRYSLPYLTALDTEQVINGQYGTFQYPESYLIDTSGKVVEKIVGPLDWSSDQVIQHVQSLL